MNVQVINGKGILFILYRYLITEIDVGEEKTCYTTKLEGKSQDLNPSLFHSKTPTINTAATPYGVEEEEGEQAPEVT